LNADIIAATSRRYVDAYERITGDAFVPAPQPADGRIRAALDQARHTRSSG
jgi:hypothetical protein